MNSNIKIALGDLRHSTLGRHSIYIPIGIGYIAAYALSHNSLNREVVRLFDDPNVLIEDIKNWKPSILSLSNYCWNAELTHRIFRYAKQINPAIICIAGGPEIPTEPEKCQEYLLNRREIDFYVVREGEVAFSNLIKKIQEGFSLNDLKSIPQEGILSIHPLTGELVAGHPLPRIQNLDVIPSPYLTGLLDKWFDGRSAPSMQMARGCPFTCAFCSGGNQWYSQVVRFSQNRLKQELTYIAERIKNYPNILLAIWDANFGMYPEDEEISVYIGELQNKFGWPNAFNVTTGKMNHERILNIASILKNKMQISCSVQSLNEETLKIIKRKNLSMDKYREIQAEIKKRGMAAVGELIMPLPAETKASFFESIKILFDHDVDYIVPYTTMLLKGTPLASTECQNRYQMKTKFRLLPRQFGEYEHEKCFEVEEVCIATSTMTFADYLEGRGFAFISALMSNKQFDVIFKHLKELNINKFDFLFNIFEAIKSGNSALSTIYDQFIEETKDELWDSKEELFTHFNKPENYNLLLAGKLGDNVIRKYKAKMFKDKWTDLIELAYAIIKKCCQNPDEKIIPSLDAARAWMFAIRKVWDVFQNKEYQESIRTLHLDYDVNKWYASGENSEPLTSFDNPTDYKIYCDYRALRNMLSQAKGLYGDDLMYQFGKIIINWDIELFWSKCEYLNNNF
ncbi:MAG TPA: cobalamin-dependent protein [Candidatus Nanoarchaeia archaeon]|nr:cobalamin-dependent protein [Candidatus Nanoarchaeia archaeon]